MQIIPVINCPDRDCVRDRIRRVASFSPWVHIDVADGVFAPVALWRTPEELPPMLESFPDAHVEVHLMTQNPEDALPSWFEAGAERAVIHWEALTDRAVVSKFPDHTILLSTKVETPIEEMLPYLTPTSWVQILAVPVGYSGKPFDLSVIEKIRVLRERFPDLTIEIDGGITPKTIQLIKGAADIATSGSYIFSSPDPVAAYRELLAA